MLKEIKTYCLSCDNINCDKRFIGNYFNEYEARRGLEGAASMSGWATVATIQSQSAYHNSVEYYKVNKLYCKECTPKIVEIEENFKKSLLDKGYYIDC